MVSPSLPALAAAFPDSAGMVTFSRNRIAHLPDVWVRGEHPTSGRKSAGSGQRLQRRAVALSLLGEEGRDVHEDPTDGDRFHISDVTDDLEPPPRHRGGYAMRASGTLTDRRSAAGCAGHAPTAGSTVPRIRSRHRSRGPLDRVCWPQGPSVAGNSTKREAR